MAITEEDVRHVARLARLNLTDAEIPRLVQDMSQILEYVVQLSELGDAGLAVADTALRAPFRADEVLPGLSNDVALEQAPRELDGAFAVPTFVDEA